MNKNIKITEDMYLSRQSNNNDFKKMNFEEKNTFLELYSFYHHLLKLYLIEKLELKKYDDELGKSNLKLKAVDVNKMDIYQYTMSDELQYLYLRNNIHIERLKKEELELLNKFYDNDLDISDINVKRFIESTFVKVIMEGDSPLITNINYGPPAPQYFAKTNSLVIGFRYDEFNLNGLSNQEWNMLHGIQHSYLFGILKNIEINLQKHIQLPVSVIEYNDYSVIPCHIENQISRINS